MDTTDNMDNMDNMSDGDEQMFKKLQKLLKDMSASDPVIQAKLNDERLSILALYDASHGYIKEDITRDTLQHKFVEFKKLIKRGSFTLKSLEDDIYSRWGIIETPREETCNSKKIKKNKIGFNLNDIDVADMPDDSPKNR